MIRHRKQRIRVRRKIHPHDIRFLVDHVIDEPWILMREAVVILPPYVRRQQVVQRSDRTPPLNIPGHLQPLGMLVEHGIDNVDEGLIARKEAVPPREQVAFQPALAHVLAEHLHHAAVLRQMFIHRQDRFHPLLVGRFVKRFQAVGSRLIRSKHAKVLGIGIQVHHVAQQAAQNTRGFRIFSAGLRNLHRILAKVRHQQVA